MKQLIAKAGIAAATSIAVTALAPVPEAHALELSPSEFGTLVFGSRDGVAAPELRELNIVDEPFVSQGVVEVGEYLNNETRGYFQYDLSSLVGDIFAPDFLDRQYTVNLGVFSDGGTGSAGSSTAGGFDGANLGNPFQGIIKASWYLGSALDPNVFDPLLGPEDGACSIFPGGCDNPLAELDMSTLGAGDSVEIDVSNLVKTLLLDLPEPTTSFGIMLQAIAPDGTVLGVCGPNAGRDCTGSTFTSNLKEVPTPAAILPTLFGLASAAFGKKRDQEESEA